MICCEGCVFDFGWKPGDTSVPYVCMCCKIINGKPTNFKPKPKTNADRIRAMTDEELAHELALIASWDRGQYKKAKSIGIEKVMMDWLKQPAEGDA